MIALRQQQHLRLVFEPAEGFAVYYAVPVALKTGAYRTRFLPALPPLAVYGQTGLRRKYPPFYFFPTFAYCHLFFSISGQVRSLMFAAGHALKYDIKDSPCR